MGIMTEMKLIKNQVEDILERFPNTRSSDKSLWWTLCQEHYGLGRELTYYEFCGMPNYVSVDRVRRKIHAEGKFLPSQEVIDKRKEEEEEVRMGIRKDLFE